MFFMKISNYILIILLGLISFSVYINSLNGDFLIDDQAGILNNEQIHDVAAYFSKYFSVRPGILCQVMQVFLWRISPKNPYYFHLFNVLAHTACVILLFILCNILFKNTALSFLSSLIFAIHPIHTEAVSWISGGHHPFSSLFFIAAMIFYVKSDKSIFNLALSVAFFALCFFSGQAVAALPVMFIMYDLFFREAQNQRLKRIRLLLLFFILGIGVLFVSLMFVGRNKFTHLIFYHRGFTYLVVAAKALVYYLKILYLPLARGLYHPFGFNTFNIQKLSPVFFLSIVILIIATLAFFKCRRNLKPVSFGIMWFFIAYAPYSNIVPVCNIVSERYLYLASAGFSILMAALFLKVWEVIKRNKSAILRGSALAAVTLFAGSYSALTIKRNYEYNNIVTYWESNINNFPDGYIVYNNLAATFYVMGNLKEAIGYCWVNLMVNPSQPHVWCNLGKLYREAGNLKDAADCYREALKIDKKYFPAHKALAEMRADE